MNGITPTLINSELRGLVAKTIIEALRGFSVLNFGNPNIGETIEENLIVAAIVIGQAEGRPLSASDIANYIGLPRPTVIRKLRTVAMSRMLGNVKMGNRACYFVKDPNNSRSMAEIHKIMHQIRKAAQQVSKMDTKKLDRRPASD